MEPVRVAVLEVEATWRECLATSLEVKGVKVVAACAEPDALFSACRSEQPGVVLVGVGPEEVEVEGGLAVVTLLRERHPEVASLVLSARAEATLVERSLQAGAAGFLCRRVAGCADVLNALQTLAQGGRLFPSEALFLSIEQRAPDARNEVLGQLTTREREVLGLVAQGDENLKIATHLGITERTVRAHVGALYRKLKCENRTQLALLGRQLGVPPRPSLTLQTGAARQ